jgi:RHS repeat-associated protein
VYSNATSASSLAEVVTVQRPNGSTTGVLAERVLTFDSFGRPWRDREKLPDGSWNVEETRYDGMGRKSMVSAKEPFSQFASPANWTSYTYDWAGRPLRVRPPDGAAHDVTYSYTGTRVVQRTTSVATSTAAEALVTVTEEYDRQGRLWRVTEPAGSGGASIAAQYSYDPAGRVRTVCAGTPGACTQQRVFNNDGRGFLTSSQQPEQGTTGNGIAYYTYDARGHLRTSRNGAANGAFDVTFIRDRAERVAEVRETGSQRVLKEFSYATANGTGDLANGRLRTARRHNRLDRWGMNVMVTETYTYGARDGRVSQRITEINEYNSLGQQVNYKGWSQNWSWTELGLADTIGYPTCLAGTPCAAISSGRTLTHSYQNGWLHGISDQNGAIASSMQYHANGMLWQIAHSNGVTSVFERDPNYMPRLGSARATYGATTYWSSGGYAYDGAGNLKRAGDNTYVYDAVNRLREGTSEWAGWQGKKQTYAYDPYGNITQMTTIVNGAIAATRTMAVDAATNRIVNGGNVVATYDEAGNQTGHNGTQTYGFDPFNMMRSQSASGKDLTFLYTADDERIWEFDAVLNRSDYTIRDLAGKVLRVFRQDNDTWTWRQDYVHRPGALVAGINVYGRYHLHVDHLGTPRSITDSNRGVSGTHHYYPFGEESTAQSQNSERMKFTGHERDTTFSADLDYLDYMHARYYNPMTGRFLGLDPTWSSADAKQPQTWNRYSYAENNPVNLTDPDGKCPSCVGGLVGGIVGVGVAGYQEIKRSMREPVTWRGSTQRILGAFAGGAVSGAVATACPTCRVAGRFGLSVGGSMAGGATNRHVTGQQQSAAAVARDAAAGTVGFVAGEAGAKIAQVATQSTVDRVVIQGAIARAEASASNQGLVRVNEAANQTLANVDATIVASSVAAAETVANLTGNALSTRAQNQPTRQPGGRL